MKKSILIIACFLTTTILNAQNNNFWSPTPESNIEVKGKRQIIPQKYLTFKLNGSALKDKLFSAPNEKTVKINESTCIISLPLPNGKTQQFKVVESSIMEPALAASFPDMKTFSIKGVEDAYANGKISWTEFGLNVMVRTVSEGDFFIDPYCLGNISDYISYYTKDFVKDPSQILPEVGVIKNEGKSQGSNEPKKKDEEQTALSSLTPAGCIGTQLNTFRLAIGCTHQYAQAATGLMAPTKAQVLAKIVISVNRVDGVYETEVGVRLVLVASETLVIFPVAAGDPYTGNNNSNTLLNESQTIITATIGTANFDIGHTFSTGGGGLATLGVVCYGQKASGITGDPSPVGDPYDIDYVAHEMGHQFGADHSFNSNLGSCSGNRYGPTSVEPGSGVTIMAYAGICSSDDLAPHSIPYFHAISYDDILSYVTSIGCAVTTTSGNNPPVVTGSGDYIVPKSTAFILTGSATDPDGDPLTYSWEETDPGPAGGPWNSGTKPYFRSYTPVTVGYRSFPNTTVVATGNYTNTKGEYAPPTAQTLHFRLTARDNKMGGGGVCYAINSVSVDASGPFVVSYPSASAITWYFSGQETITWNVNGTNAAPVSCDTVRVLISYDSGATYSVMLNSTPNDGTQLVAVPTVTALISTCRIKVEGKGNIFYDISDNDFIVSNLPQGIREISKSNPIGLSVWPNPFTSQFNFAAGNLKGSSPVVLKVTDVLGKTILSNKYTNKTEIHETINLSDINPGIYFISVSNDDLQAVYRIIKE